MYATTRPGCGQTWKRDIDTSSVITCVHNVYNVSMCAGVCVVSRTGNGSVGQNGSKVTMRDPSPALVVKSLQVLRTLSGSFLQTVEM
jgi:hypothetical protein